MDNLVDDFDFLMGGSGPPVAPPSASSSSPAAAAPFSIDDEDDDGSAAYELLPPPGITNEGAAILESDIPDFLLDVAAVMARPVVVETAAAPLVDLLDTAPQSSLNNAPVDDDFLAWLDTKHPLQPSASASSADASPSISVASVLDASRGSPSVGAAVSPALKKTSELIKYENEILRLINSSFPDVEALRAMVVARGFVLAELRGQVWSLLLHGSCSQDHEVEFWQSSGQELNNYDVISRDCDAWVDLMKTRGCLSESAASAAARDLIDIVVLYCVRRNLPYRPIYCDVLASMVLSERPVPRALASSCFYNLCSEMLLPAADLPISSQEKYFAKLQAWLRYLLKYHFPQLCAHLDAVAPGWENRVESPSPAQIQAARMEYKNALVPESGGSGSGDLLGNTGTLPRFHMERGISGGCIPQNWMHGVFGGALSPEQSCWIWDWLLIRGNPHAGIFLVCALFGLHSEAIMKLDGAQIFDWIRSATIGISTDCQPWVRVLPLDSDVLKIDGSSDLDLDNYTRAWIHAADVLRQSTPSGFLRSLKNIEKVALTPSSILDNNTSLRRGQSESASSAVVSSGGASAATGGGVLLIDKLRKISSQLQSVGENKTKLPPDEHGNKNSRNENDGSAFETAILSDHCLWSSPDEVVPCMISSSKGKFSTQLLDQKMKLAFRDAYFWNASKSESLDEKGTESLRGGEGFVLPILDESNKPFFFGIDCRSGNELLLGKFPKALSIDPSDLKDSYSVSTVLKTLEPLIGHVHFCIIGVGEIYLRSGTSSPDSMAANYNIVAEVIEFFLRRNLRHISFLTGGISGAINYIMRDDVPIVLGSSLVDVEPAALDEVFGKGSAATHLGMKRSEPSASNVHSTGTSLLPNLFANRHASSSDVHVVDVTTQKAPAADSSNGLFSFVSSLASSQSAAPNRGPSPSLEVNAAGSQKPNFFSAGASLFGIRLGSQPSVETPVPELILDEGNKDSESNAPKGAFVIDDDDLGPQVSKPNSQFAEAPNESGVTNDPFGIPKSLSKTKLFGGIKRSTSGILSASTPEASVATGSAVATSARLGGSGLVDVDPLKIGVSKSDAEKAQALAMHKLAGLQKGDKIVISRETLPGALLFPARKLKASPSPNPDASMETSTDQNDATSIELSRFIVLTKERIIVLDANGGGVGAEASVKSNHHLTELVKLTFRKRDPELVTLYVTHDVVGAEAAEDLDAQSRGAAPSAMKVKQYRLVKRNELVEMLQIYMKRFK